MFNSFPKSKFEIIGPDGIVRTTVEAIDGGDGTIVVPDALVIIQPGDEMRRALPNGTDETFDVLDPQFHENFHGIPAHFQVKVRKKGTFPHHTGGHLNITVSGPNARLNVGSTDNSTNIVGNTTVFGDLANAIANGVTDTAAREELLAAINAMQQAHGSGGFVGAYQKFMSLAADHMGVIGPFLPALAGLLG
jgi:hypothetical protein